MHVLHLIDAIERPPAPVMLGVLGDLIAAQPDLYHRVCVVGPRDLADETAAAGVRVDDHVPTAARSRWRAWWGLRRYMANCGAPGLMHAWTPAGARLAGRVCDWPVQPGLPAGLDVGLDTARLGTAQRRATRLRWGVADDATLVIAALGDDVGRIDPMLVMTGVGLARQAGRAVRVVISDRAAALHRALHVCDAVGTPELVTPDRGAERPWEVLAGCDMAIVLEGHGCAAWSMAAGVPIVAAPDAARAAGLSPATSEPFKTGLAGDLARVLCEMADDPQRRRTLAAAGQAEAAIRFDLPAFAGAMRRVYDQSGSVDAAVRAGRPAAAARSEVA